MLKSSFCDYSGAYILVTSTITINGRPENDTDENKRTDKKKQRSDILKLCTIYWMYKQSE